MKLSRRELLAAGAASVTARSMPAASHVEPGIPWQPAAPSQKPAAHPANLPIRDYLAAEARRITNNALSDLRTAADFDRSLPERRRRFMHMMGLADLQPASARRPVPYKVTGTLDRPSYRIEKLHYESLPNLHVTANLYVPKATQSGARLPGVLYLCGHEKNQKVAYQAHPKRFAELGFPTLIVETVQLGEVTGHHHGCYQEGWFHWYSRGYSPAAIELFNGIRGLDLLAARPDVDGERLGVTGISGGSATTWWIAAADERIKACAPVCGTATLAAHIYDRVIDGHCDCMWWTNTALWDLTDIGALIAPRPLLIASANADGIFPIASIREAHARLEGLYRTLGKANHLRFVETPGGHSYHERSRTAVFSWFLEHLMGKSVPPSQVGDLEIDAAKLESVESLAVYASGAPTGNRALTIHDEFITVAVPPPVASAADVTRARAQVVERLKADTFNHFPRTPPPLAVEEEYALDGGVGSRFAFTAEDGWRLHGLRRQPPGVAAGATPAVVILKSPGEDRLGLDSDTFAQDIRAPWIKVIVETRGTGDTSWGDDLNWHVRRASAWTGRTIASMRVWDALRGLAAARALTGVDPARVSIAARGEMAIVALYAALLDGRITSVLLDSPPATQNAASQPSGKGPAIEMLNCLRYTDAPHVAGLLYPARVVIAGEVPSTYAWAEDLYRRLGSPGTFQRVKVMSEWAAP
jgi:cephalosporin-C deacetylase-like acetyl esterase